MGYGHTSSAAPDGFKATQTSCWDDQGLIQKSENVKKKTPEKAFRTVACIENISVIRLSTS